MNMPVSFFSMAVGTLAWGHIWQAAALVWPLPTWLVTVASALGLWWAGRQISSFGNFWRPYCLELPILSWQCSSGTQANCSLRDDCCPPQPSQRHEIHRSPYSPRYPPHPPHESTFFATVLFVRELMHHLNFVYIFIFFNLI